LALHLVPPGVDVLAETAETTEDYTKQSATSIIFCLLAALLQLSF